MNRHRAIRGCLTYPGQTGVQARIKSAGREYSQYFSFGHYKPGGAERAARRWLASMATQLPGKPPIRQRRQVNNITGVSGISRTILYDKRKDQFYVRYQVNWHDGDKQRNKVFTVGNRDTFDERDEQAAFDAACDFRETYAKARLENRPFDSRPWLNWKIRHG